MFVNHQFARLALDDPAMSVMPVYVLLFIAAALSMKKAAGQGFLDAGQTGQLKGLAILLIVTGHINLILAKGMHVPNFSGFGVAAFLFCSGYGLAASAMEKGYTATGFLAKRASRIFLPYWAVTSVIVVADYMVYGRHYRNEDMAYTMLGMNVTGFSARFDPSRWFVTYILLMYILYIVSCAAVKSWKGRTALLIALSVLVDAALVLGFMAVPNFLDPGYVRHYVMYSLLFPVGCLAAVHAADIRASLARVINRPSLRAGAIFAVILFFLVKTLFGDPVREMFDRADVGSILLESALWQPAFAVFLLIALAALAALNPAGFRSRFLLFVGGISYEVYLVHFVFMQRYDPMLYRKPFALWFLIFLAVVLSASFLLNRSVARVRRLLRLDIAPEGERVV